MTAELIRSSADCCQIPSFSANDPPGPPRPALPHHSPSHRYPTPSDSPIGQHPDSDDQVFSSHTAITVARHGRRFYLAKRDQTSEVERVLRRAIQTVTRSMGINPENPEFVPFNQSHIETLCLDALLDAATDLGYDGPGDIRDRLLNGDFEKYIRPMRAYVRDLSCSTDPCTDHGVLRSSNVLLSSVHRSRKSPPPLSLHFFTLRRRMMDAIGARNTSMG